MIEDILFNFFDQNWYYVLAISLQLSGALLLIIFFFGNREGKVLATYFDGADPIGVEKDRKVTLKKEKLRKIARQIYLNRASFVFIALGYFIGIFGEITIESRGYIAICVMIATIIWMVLGYGISIVVSVCVYRKDVIKDYSEVEEYASKCVDWIDIG